MTTNAEHAANVTDIARALQPVADHAATKLLDAADALAATPAPVAPHPDVPSPSERLPDVAVATPAGMVACHWVHPIGNAGAWVRPRGANVPGVPVPMSAVYTLADGVEAAAGLAQLHEEEYGPGRGPVAPAGPQLARFTVLVDHEDLTPAQSPAPYTTTSENDLPGAVARAVGAGYRVVGIRDHQAAPASGEDHTDCAFCAAGVADEHHPEPDTEPEPVAEPPAPSLGEALQHARAVLATTGYIGDHYARTALVKLVGALDEPPSSSLEGALHGARAELAAARAVDGPGTCSPEPLARLVAAMAAERVRQRESRTGRPEGQA